MTPKEKAIEIVYQFASLTNDSIVTNLAKQSALIAVDLLIKEHTWKSPIGWNIERKRYWNLVKQEIENL
jgi:hypothetical protein